MNSGNKRKLEDVWLEDYFFIRKNDTHALCLLCVEKNVPQKAELNIGRSTGIYGFKRHFVNLHQPAGSLDESQRKEKAYKLAEEYLQKYPRQVTENDRIGDAHTNYIKASYIIAHKIVQKGKPLNEGEFLKDAMLATADLICPHEVESFEKLKLGRDTITARMEHISKYVFAESISNFKKCQCFSLCFDESTDIKDKAQLLIFFRGITKDFEIIEELAEMRTMNGTTRGEDYFREVLICLENIGVDIRQLISVTTDGAASLTGIMNGFRAHFSKYMKETYPNHHRPVLYFHCLIHQEALCKKSIKLNSVMTVVNDVVKFIRGSSLKHRQFQQFADDLDSGVTDVKYHCHVRWLSMGEVLARVHKLLPVIIGFLDEHENENLSTLQDDNWLNDFAFAVDIMQHLNVLNSQLQGKGQFVTTMVRHINDFLIDIESLVEDIKSKEFKNFAKLKERHEKVQSNQLVEYCAVITDLQSDFSDRFKDFRKIEHLLNCVEFPFTCDTSKLCAPLVACLNKLRQDTEAEEKFEKMRNADNLIWFYAELDDREYFDLKSTVKFISAIFGSTYICESTFSVMKYNKSNQRAQLTDGHLQDILRISSTNIDVDYDVLTHQKQKSRKKYI